MEVGYRGVLLASLLGGLSTTKRRDMWNRVLSQEAAKHVFIAERDGRAVGFVAVGPDRTDSATGEIYALYQHEDVAGTGIAGSLLAHGEAVLARAGFTTAILWVLAVNRRARGFYERCGWCADGPSKTVEFEGARFDELRYAKVLQGARELRAAQLR